MNCAHIQAKEEQLITCNEQWCQHFYCVSCRRVTFLDVAPQNLVIFALTFFWIQFNNESILELLKPTRILNRSLKSVKFWLDYYKHFNSMRTKFTKPKHLRVRRMLAARIFCMLVQPFIIQLLISIIAAVRMWFDTLLAGRSFCVLLIHCNQAKVFQKTMDPFIPNNRFQYDKGIFNHDTGLIAHVLRAKRIGRSWKSSTIKLDWGIHMRLLSYFLEWATEPQFIFELNYLYQNSFSDSQVLKCKLQPFI